MKRTLRPLRRQMLVLLSFFLVCIIGITIWNAASYIRIQKESLLSNLDLYAGYMAQTTVSAYASYESIAYSVAYNNAVQDYIQEEDAGKRYEAFQQVYNLLNNTAKLNSNIADIAILSPDGNSMSLTSSTTLYEDYSEAVAVSSNSFVSMGTLSVRGSLCHILAMPIHQLTSSGQYEYLGTAFLAVNCQRFFGVDLIDDTMESPEVLFLDNRDQLIYGNQALMSSASGLAEGTVSELTADGVRYLGRMYSIPAIGGRLCVLFDSSGYTRASLTVSLRLVLGNCLAMLVFVAVFLVILHPISTSLAGLTGTMRKISEGEQKIMKNGIDLTGVRFGSTEIRDVYTAFNNMLLEINRLNHTIFHTYTKMYELEANNRQTELAYLRSQINPHFLYNTLATVCGLAADGRNEKIIEVANALSRIFRYSIQGSDMVSLKEELNIIRAYLMIQSCRFEDRFSVRYCVAPETLSVRMPKMIIQPLVENAIIHGLEPCLHRGSLIISASLNETRDHLLISVTDTGVGMTAERLGELRGLLASDARRKGASENPPAEPSPGGHDSIGIFNVNNRIVLYYGEDYGIDLDSWEGAGTNVTVRIPCTVSDKEDSACTE